jgi:hypothetical protein
MVCPKGTYSVKAHQVKSSCRKAKGGIPGQELRQQLALEKQLKRDERIAKLEAKKMKRSKARGGAMGPRKKRARKQ